MGFSPKWVKSRRRRKKKRRERKKERLNDGENNGQAMHGARKHAWRTQAAWANWSVLAVLSSSPIPTWPLGCGFKAENEFCFVCFMSWSGIPHSFQKSMLLWLKTTGLALNTKCQSVCLSMSFILRNFSDQSRHFSNRCCLLECL